MNTKTSSALSLLVSVVLLASGCPRLPQGSTRADGGGGTKETPTPTTAPNSRANEAGGSANRPENFGDITNPRSPVQSPGAEKQAPKGDRAGTPQQEPAK